MKVAIIGAGWYGIHMALVLKKQGHVVEVYEKNSDIANLISGIFGIRLHAGPHYPRSAETRENCRAGFDKFIEAYPELVVKLAHSIYGLADRDADNEPSKVNEETFRSVCKETKKWEEIDPESWGYKHFIMGMNIEERAIAIGEKLRNIFKKKLADASIPVFCNFEIKAVEEQESKTVLKNGEWSKEFDYVINATGYQALLPKELPFDMEIFYQPSIALEYIDTQPQSEDPEAVILMEGSLPCVMPVVDKNDSKEKKYILTHGRWTIMGAKKTVSEAEDTLKQLNNKDIEETVKPNCERQIINFMPGFAKRFQYVGYRQGVLAKFKTNTEFRSAVTFQQGRVFYIIPGKVSNIFDAETEIVKLMNNQDVKIKGDFRYVNGGVLHKSLNEILEKPDPNDKRNTAAIQTFDIISREKIENTQTEVPLPNLNYRNPSFATINYDELRAKAKAKLKIKAQQEIWEDMDNPIIFKKDNEEASTALYRGPVASS